MSDPSKLLFSISKRLAKYTISCWTGIDPQLIATSEDIVEYISEKFYKDINYKDARKVKLQYEVLVDSFSDNLEHLQNQNSISPELTSRFVASKGLTVPGLNDEQRRELQQYINGEISSALEAVDESFDNTTFSVQDILDRRLEPLPLEEQILSENSALYRDLSSPAKQLYMRTVRDCCQLLAGLTTKMPDFSRAAIQTILKSQDNLGSRLDEIAANISSITTTNSTSEETFRDFDARLKMNIARNMEMIRLFGISGQEETTRYDLMTSFLYLDAQVIYTKDHSVREKSIENIIENGSRLFIRGEAGTGKTTVLQWIAFMAATRGFSGNLSKLNEKIPVFIKLRSTNIWELDPTSLVKYMAPSITPWVPEGWLEFCLENNRFMFLIDGVDEVKSNQRDNIKNWLIDLIEEYPKQNYYITSRPSAVGHSWLEPLGFDTVNVRPMNEAKIATFIDRWHDAVARSPLVKLEKGEIETYKRRVLSIVRSNRQVRSVASYPLLAAILCSMNYQRSGQLPRSRMDFYRAAIEALLEGRDAARSDELGSTIDLTSNQKELVVRAIAFWYVQNRISEAKTKEVKACIRRACTHLTKVNASVDAIYEFLIERSGLMREPADDIAEFVHKSFHEYLAAHELVQQDFVQYMVDHAHEDEFRETFIMAIGHSLAGQRERTLRNLLARCESNPSNERVLVQVLSASLEVCDRLAPSLTTQILERVRSICPPSNNFEARDLSHSIELEPKLLSGIAIEDSQSISASIVAMCLSGKTETLDLVRTLSVKGGKDVSSALIDGIEYFDPHIYGAAVLPRLHFEGDLHIDESDFRFVAENGSIDRTVKIHGVESLDFLRGMKGLHQISISGHENLRDASGLETCENLRSVSLDFCPELTRLGNIVHLSGLTSIDIIHCGSIDPEFIERTRREDFPILIVRTFNTAELMSRNKNKNVQIEERFYG